MQSISTSLIATSDIKQVTLCVVMPLGPSADLDYVCDTIESIKHYLTPSHVIILVDDSSKGTGTIIRDRYENVFLLTNRKTHGKFAGLYVTVSRGFDFAIRHFDFKVALRLDTDALVIGPNPEYAAIEYFTKHSDVGILGLYRTHCNGSATDFSWPRDQLFNELTFRALFGLRALKSPVHRIMAWRFLRKIFRRSISQGYEPGESCLGGAYFISKDCIARLSENNLLNRRDFLWSKLGEDHIFGLLIHSVGLTHGDFASASLPMGLRWRGLPCSPEELIGRKKKIIHSTRFFENMSESAIRDYFRKCRRANTVHL
jgi:glycosyltransferase involved in cell wall biosynthesis